MRNHSSFQNVSRSPRLALELLTAAGALAGTLVVLATLAACSGRHEPTPSQSTPVFEWLGMLGYPWTSAHDLAASAPKIAALSPILQYLQADAARPTSVHA